MTANQLLIDLQTEMWDFYKDVHGIRPRHWTQEQWDSMEFLQAQREALIKTIDAMTPEQKIAEGWGSNAEFEFPDCEDDGDALKSAGWGTDEDYGYAEDVM
jgi:hypothetical protein